MDSPEQSLGSRKRPACGCWAFQCLLKVGTRQCVGSVMQFDLSGSSDAR
jgi:hypothetical protein